MEDELRHLRSQLDDLHGQCRNLMAEGAALKHQMEEARMGRQVAEAEAQLREQMCRSLTSEKEAGMQQMSKLETALREERESADVLKRQVCVWTSVRGDIAMG